MVLIQLYGCHHFQVFGALWEGDADSLLVADPLTRPLSLLYVPTDPLNGYYQLARVVTALLTLHQKLKDFNESPTDISPYYKCSDIQYDPLHVRHSGGW